MSSFEKYGTSLKRKLATHPPETLRLLTIKELEMNIFREIFLRMPESNEKTSSGGLTDQFSTEIKPYSGTMLHPVFILRDSYGDRWRNGKRKS